VQEIERVQRERVHLLNKCHIDQRAQEIALNLIDKDIIYFFKYFLNTYDPRLKIKTVPFIPFKFQEDLIKKLEDSFYEKKPLLVEKTRDMGFSWVVLGWILHKMLTIKGFSAGVGSYKMLLVDDIGNMKSLLQKVRFMIRSLPTWMLPDYNEGKHSKYGLITIPHMGSHLAGEAGDNIGRGDRTSVYVLDEFAHVERSAAVHEAVSQTTDCIVFSSTPKGKGNEFARLRWKTNIDRIQLHWRDHPNKNDAWYEKQKATMTAEMVAQELDVSYNKSMTGKVYKWFNADIHAQKLKAEQGAINIVSADWGIGDPMAMLFMQYHHNVLHIIDHFEVADKGIDTVIPTELIPMLNRHGLGLHDINAWYGDPDGRNRNPVNAQSIAGFIKAKYRINLRFKVPNVIKNRILSVRMLGENNRILVNEELHSFIECLENYRYPEKEHGENEVPIHDWTSHSCSALEYYCVYEHGMDQYENRNRQITERSWR